ncbi:aldehyde dehydrogenase family protein [Rhodococcus ruber]|uniref:aldehyde dehydrogenase family protein n=1 Tax=Rhodococcus ruber TaxID=1830 RepID=UPI00265E8AD5|nr:aldehyde dehydrogenase family protein [Rhodococcus ruber]MDO1481605.1 aldehyde dehydrogenase family protein [Rhodococcus ruber]
MPDYSKIYIDGAWVPSQGQSTIDVLNPATEHVIATVPAGTAADVDAAVSAARAAFDPWSRTPVETRVGYLRAIAQRLVERRDDIATLISQEMGAPIGFAVAAQAALPINSFSHAADLVEKYEFERQEGPSVIVREPIGVIGAITPWNYPLHQIAGKVAYALAAGNTVVVKPSEVAPLDAWALAEIIAEVELPAGVFNLVSGTGEVVGEAISGHPDIDMVSFTGSTRAGRRIGARAAETVKRVALELGGKSPNVVLPDADLPTLMPTAVMAAMVNSGQTCSALTRMVVPRSTLSEVEDLAKQVAESLSVGDPAHESTDLGPLASKQQLDRVRGYIDRALEEGARLVTGGSGPVDGLGTGYYVAPTILSAVTTEMEIHREEVFGPVLVLEPYDDEDDAVRIANDTCYGLAGGVWSGDPARAREIAGRIRAGQISINGGDFNPNAPFGGYKQSGIGREFGIHGLEEFLETKSLQY